MDFVFPGQSITWTAVFSIVVMVIFWFEYRRVRARLLVREEQMKRRMYELSILRELGERIGYSLNVRKIVEIITGSLQKLLPYSTAAYMLPAEADGRIEFRISLSDSVSKSFVSDVRSRMLKSFSALFGKSFTESDVDESVSGVVTDPNNNKTVRSFFHVPIVINQKPAGILTVASTTSGLYKTSEEVEILYTIMNQASEAVSKLLTVLEIEKGKLNAMVASMADGVLMVDTHSRLLVANPKMKEMLGVKSSEPTIFDVLDAISGRFDLRTRIEQSRREDKLIVEQELQLGDRFLQILISPVKDKKDQPLGSVVLFHDITREKEVEKMRQDFTSMMVHELRSPLTGIRSIAGLLKNEKIKNEASKYQEFVELISSNSSSMLDLVNDLLDIAKLESGKFEVFKRPADLRHLIVQRVESFATLAAENKLVIEQKIFPEVPQSMQIDEMKMAQVFNNLLSNAIKFTTDGGRVTIGAFVCRKGEDLSTVAAEKELPWQRFRHEVICPVDEVVVSVSDTGAGIPEGEIGKLFNKFQQLSTASRSEKKGTGLGLVIVKGVVEAHGGQVGVSSEEGNGTTFYFTLPLDNKA